jgi:hypothetical protein
MLIHDLTILRGDNGSCQDLEINVRIWSGGATMPQDRGQPPEPWLTKQQLADHLAVSGRWIELQQHRGLPYLRMGGLNRYRVSQVEAWLREHYSSPAEGD